MRSAPVGTIRQPGGISNRKVHRKAIAAKLHFTLLLSSFSSVLYSHLGFALRFASSSSSTRPLSSTFVRLRSRHAAGRTGDAHLQMAARLAVNKLQTCKPAPLYHRLLFINSQPREGPFERAACSFTHPLSYLPQTSLASLFRCPLSNSAKFFNRFFYSTNHRRSEILKHERTPA